MATDSTSPPNPLKRQLSDFTLSSIEPSTSQTMLPPPKSSTTTRPSTPTAADCTNTSQNINDSHSRSSSILSDIGEHTPPPPTPPAAGGIQVKTPLLPAGHTAPAGQQNAFQAMNGVPEPPKKKVKLTFAEQEDRRIKKEIAAAEKAQEKEKRDQEKKEKEAEREVERKKRDAEREAERASKEAEKKKKEQEKEEKRRVKEEEHAKKEAERKKKEDEKREVEETRRKKEGRQPKLAAFFGKPVVKREKEETPVKIAAISETKEEKQDGRDKEWEEYEKRWPPFFVYEGVTIAQPPGQRDEGARRKLEEEIDACLSGSKHVEPSARFDVTEAFNMPAICFGRRGAKHVTRVRDIMAELLGTGATARPVDLTTDAQNRKLKAAREALKHVPFKILKFWEDVRPPYTGTYTKEPSNISLASLARNPHRRVQELDYEYDSEAEWEEPGEDEEDLGSEDEEEEEIEGEDFDGFLDDADDEVTKSRRALMVGDNLEPVSTGLCFEDEKGRVSTIEVLHFKMDILNEYIKSNEPIDPFSTTYWPSPAPPPSMQPPRIPLNALKNTTSPPPAGPQTAKITDMFGIKPSSSTASKLSAAPPSTAGSSLPTKNPVGRPPKNAVAQGDGKEKKLIPEEYMEKFKKAVEGNDLSKLGLIEVLNKTFKSLKKGEIKNTLEKFAERRGTVEREKVWVWRG